MNPQRIAIAALIALAAAAAFFPCRAALSAERSGSRENVAKKTLLSERALYEWRKKLAELDRALGREGAEKLIPALLLLEKKHADADLFRVMVRAYRLAGRKSEAAAAQENYLRFAPMDAVGWEQLGVLRQGLGEIRGAEKAYNKALELDPTRYTARSGLAVIRFNECDYAAACKDFTDLLRAGEDNAMVLEGAAYSAYQLDDWEVAAGLLRQLLPMKPDEANLRVALAECLYRRGDYKELSRLLKDSLGRFPVDERLWLLQANAATASGDYGNAIDAYRALDAMRGLDSEERLALAELLSAVGLPAEAAEEYSKAFARLEKDGGKPAKRDRISYAESLADSGKVFEAAEVYRRLVADFPRDARLMYGLGWTAWRAGKIEAAETAFSEAAGIEPGSGGAWLALGDVRLERGALDDAEDAYSAAAALPSAGPDGEAGLGEVARRRGKLEEALEHYRAASQAAPDSEIFSNMVNRLEEEIAAGDSERER